MQLKWRDGWEALEQQKSGAYWSELARAWLAAIKHIHTDPKYAEGLKQMAVYCQRQSAAHYERARQHMGFEA